jgi:hypothetical protein
MKLLEGRSTSIKLPDYYVQKIEKYIQPQFSIKDGISEIVEQLIYLNVESDNLPYQLYGDGEKVYINQNLYREFFNKAKKRGYKNGLECLKDLILEKESQALQYGNEKRPNENPWDIEIGEKHINLATQAGIAIVGDSDDNKNKVTNYIVNQLSRNQKGNETDIYQIEGESTFHKTKSNPFEKNASIVTNDFLNWIDTIVDRRIKFLEDKGYTFTAAIHGGLGINLNLPHNFSRIFIVIDSEKMTEDVTKQINNICRSNNEISGIKLFGLNIHMIVKVSREKYYEIIDDKTPKSFLNFMTGLIETDGQDIENGEQLALTTRITTGREIINAKGLLY